MEEMHTKPNCAANFKILTSSLLESLVAETDILAHKSLLLLLFLVWSPTNNTNVLPDLVRADQRFPMSEFTKVKEPDAENNDAGEAVDDEDDDNGDGDSDGDDEDDGNDSDEDSDDDEDDSDDEVVPSGYGDSDEDEDDNDDSDSDDVDDSDEETDENDEDDEEQFKLPLERKK